MRIEVDSVYVRCSVTIGYFEYCIRAAQSSDESTAITTDNNCTRSVAIVDIYSSLICNGANKSTGVCKVIGDRESDVTGSIALANVRCLRYMLIACIFDASDITS